MYDLQERKHRVKVLFSNKWTPAQLQAHRKRLLRISSLLHDEFPSPYPWKISQTNKIYHRDYGCGRWPLFGCCTYIKSHIIIEINSTLPLFSKVETLLHEWAHAHNWRQPTIERVREDPHDDEFYLILGRIERWWSD